MMKRNLFVAACFALVSALLLGCSSTTPPAKDGAKKNGEEHGEKGPHGGTLFATPDHKYHLELVAEKGKPATLYVLDSRVKNAVPTAAETFTLTIKGDKPVKVTFKAKRGEGLTKASEFTAGEGEMPETVDFEKVEISGEIDGKPYHFKLDEE